MDEVVGSARIRIEPDMSQFDAALRSGVSASVEQAARTIVAELRGAVDDVTAAVSSIGSEGFSDLGQSASQAAQELRASLGDAAEDAGRSLSGIGEGVAEQLEFEFARGGQAIRDGIADGLRGAETDVAAAVRSIDDRLAGLTAGGREIVIRASIDQADREISAIQRRLADPTLTDHEINILVDEHGAATAALADLRTRMGEYTTETEQAVEATGRLNVSVKQIATVIGGALAGSFVQAGASYNTLLQTSQAAMTIILGTQEAAADMIQEIAQFAMTSPFPRQAFIEATQILLGFGFEAEKIVPTLSAIQDAVAATGGSAQQISELVQVFARVQSTGNVTITVFNQLALRGIDAASLLADAWGMTVEEIRSAVSTGALDAEETLTTLTEVLTETYGGAAEGVKATFEGARDRIRGAIRDISSDLLIPWIDPVGGGAAVEMANQIADAMRRAQREVVPALAGVSSQIGEAATTSLGLILELASAFATGLLPAISGTNVVLAALVPLIEAVSAVLEAIPDPLLQIVTTTIALQRTLLVLSPAMAAVRAGLVAMAVPSGAVAGAFNGAAVASRGLGGALTVLRGALTAGNLALIAGAGAFVMYNNMMDNARKRGTEWAQGVAKDFDLASMSYEELADLSDRLGDGIDELRDSVKGGWRGFTIDRDYNAEIKAGADELERYKEEVDAAASAARRAAAEDAWGQTARSIIGLNDSLAAVRRESVTTVEWLRVVGMAGETSSAGILGLVKSLERVSPETLSEAANLLGTDVDSLTEYISEVRTAIDEFVNEAVSKLPSVSAAFRDMNEDGKISAQEFITALQEDTAAIAKFFTNVRTIVGAGFSDIASLLVQEGPEVAGLAAEEMARAVEAGNTTMLEEWRAGLEERNAVMEEANEILTRLGEEFVTTTGLLSDEAAEAFGINFDVADRVAADLMLARSELSQQGKEIAVIAAIEGEDAAREYGEAFDVEQEVIDEAIKVGEALRDFSTDDAKTGGSRLGRAFIEGVEGAFRRASAREAVNYVNMLESRARKAADARSPSRLFMRLGEDIIDGVAVGITDHGRAVVDAAEKVVRDAANAISGEQLEVGIRPLTLPMESSGALPELITMGRTAPAAVGATDDGAGLSTSEMPRTAGEGATPGVVQNINLTTTGVRESDIELVARVAGWSVATQVPR